jgi:hypothetical protein
MRVLLMRSRAFMNSRCTTSARAPSDSPTCHTHTDLRQQQGNCPTMREGGWGGGRCWKPRVTIVSVRVVRGDIEEWGCRHARTRAEQGQRCARARRSGVARAPSIMRAPCSQHPPVESAVRWTWRLPAGCPTRTPSSQTVAPRCWEFGCVCQSQGVRTAEAQTHTRARAMLDAKQHA